MFLSLAILKVRVHSTGYFSRRCNTDVFSQMLRRFFSVTSGLFFCVPSARNKNVQ